MSLGIFLPQFRYDEDGGGAAPSHETIGDFMVDNSIGGIEPSSGTIGEEGSIPDQHFVPDRGPEVEEPSVDLSDPADRVSLDDWATEAARIQEQHGVDVSSYKSRDEFYKAWAEQRRYLSQAAEKARKFEQIEPYMPQLNEAWAYYQQRDQQPQQPQPEDEKFDQALLEQIYRDPESGEWRERPGAPAGTLGKVQKFMKKQTELTARLVNEGVGAVFGDEINDIVNQRVQDQIRQYQAQQQEQQYTNQLLNLARQEMFEDPNRPDLGYSPWGRAVYSEWETIARERPNMPQHDQYLWAKDRVAARGIRSQPTPQQQHQAQVSEHRQRHLSGDDPSYEGMLVSDDGWQRALAQTAQQEGISLAEVMRGFSDNRGVDMR